jgi:hypothetical protein
MAAPRISMGTLAWLLGISFVILILLFGFLGIRL